MSAAALLAAILGGAPRRLFTATVSTTEADYDVAAEATTDGWNGTDILVASITVNGTGDITGFDTGSLPNGSTCDLTVQSGGIVRGHGGDGGDGGSSGGGADGGAGGAGQTSVDYQANGSITIDVGGEISGGGGGGGGGESGFDVQTHGGGGGGGGYPNGTGGTGGTGAGSNGDAGLDGTTGGGGTGGVANDPSASPGANGGDEAAAGGGGGSQGTAGAAGAAIDKNGNTVSVTENGTRNGAIIA